MTNSIRVAAAQFHVGDDVDTNLNTCLRMIREAGAQKPDLLVLPELFLLEQISEPVPGGRSLNTCSLFTSVSHTSAAVSAAALSLTTG